MQKRCSSCATFINKDNCVRRDEKTNRNQCRPCINTRNRGYLLRNGFIKLYACENCGKECLRDQIRALCSLRCRLLGNIEKNGDCWLWLGKKTSDGYGELMIEGKRYRVHRISFELFKGVLSPESNIIVRHECDRPSCINPDHLYQGTNQDNMNDMKMRGRSLVGGKNPMRIDLSHIRKKLSLLVLKLK